MDRLKSYEVFVAVVEAGGFSRAASMLNMSNAAVSEHVAFLERRIGQRLLSRNNRRIQLTAEGSRMLPEARHLIETIRDMEKSGGPDQTSPAGRVRLDAPMSIGMTFIVPFLPLFRSSFPDIALDLTLSDRGAELQINNADLVLHTGKSEHGNVVSHTLGWTRFLQLASPDYLRRRKPPSEPDALQAHDCVLYASVANPGGQYWRFNRDGETRWLRPPTRLTLNNGLALRQAAINGLGLIQNLEMLVLPELANGSLEAVLTDWNRKLVPVNLFAERDRAGTQAVVAVMEFLRDVVAWPAPLPETALASTIE